MKTSHDTFSTGDFQCTLLADGMHDYPDPARLLFSNAPRDELHAELSACGIPPGNWPIWTSDYTCLMVDTGEQRILLDTGAGSLLPQAGKLVKNMRAAGITPESVDCIAISHAHPDHLGGAALFPNAKILMHREEWRFWTENPRLPRLPLDFEQRLISMVASLLFPLQERMELVDGDTETAPGITMLQAPGHTPGHMAVHVASQDEHLVYAGDAVLHEIHVRKPHWNALVDAQPERVAPTRHALLSLAAEKQALFFGLHLPQLGRICRTKDGFQWNPHDAASGSP